MSAFFAITSPIMFSYMTPYGVTTHSLRIWAIEDWENPYPHAHRLAEQCEMVILLKKFYSFNAFSDNMLMLFFSQNKKKILKIDIEAWKTQYSQSIFKQKEQGWSIAVSELM